MTTSALLGLLAQTSIHAGASTQTGIIDLPIQREGHSGYPCVFGSSVKGALRARAEARQDKDVVSSVYGAPPKQPIDSAGAIIVTDARLLLFPVRSLTSQFKWVTCPDVLRRYQDDCRRLDFMVDLGLKDLPEIKPGTAIIHGDDATEENKPLFLEEYRFEAETKILDSVVTALAQLMQRDDVEPALKKQLVIVDNDSFTHLVNHATPVNAHIALDSETKTAAGGALWYEETLPPETLLYLGLSANASRRQDTPISAEKILDHVLTLFPPDNPYLQLGGNETVGMGWCIVKRLEN